MSNVDLDVEEGWVRMYHPDLPDDKGRVPTTVVTREAFEDNHSEKGWKVVSDSDELKHDVDRNTIYVIPSAKAKPSSSTSSSSGGDA